MAEREKMPLEKRAKQFMPFSALNGLDAALRQKEWEIESRQKAKHRIINPENTAELDKFDGLDAPAE